MIKQALCLLALLISHPLLAQEGLGPYKIDGPYTSKNLSIFLIRGKTAARDPEFLTLKEALEQKKARVHETEDVNNLYIENLTADRVIFVQSGDIVKGGKQDRVLSHDFILPPKSGRVNIAAFCVEQGRWSPRGAESPGEFKVSEEMVATKELKRAAHAESQSTVWEGVAKVQKKLSAALGQDVRSKESESSLQLTLENAPVRQTVGEYTKDLLMITQGKGDTIGYAYTVNGLFSGADIYSSSHLFHTLWGKLLNAAAVEAASENMEGPVWNAVTDIQVRSAMADAEKGAASERKPTATTRLITRETDRHLLFDTLDVKRGERVHRNYLAK